MSPTDKEQMTITFEADEEATLRRIFERLRNPTRRGRPGYLGQRLSLNRWIVKLAVERARQVDAEIVD